MLLPSKDRLCERHTRVDLGLPSKVGFGGESNFNCNDENLQYIPLKEAMDAQFLELL